MTTELVRALLLGWRKHRWSLQGFGMLRLHMTDEVRLNVWDSRYRIPDVSMMHTHPWDFTSLVVAGALRNYRYAVSWQGDIGGAYDHAVIKPGPGGGLLEKRGRVQLVRLPREDYRAGQTYFQNPDEIHVSAPDDGTVTLNYRVRAGEDSALVYWPAGGRWVSAEPREATEEEVERIVTNALARFEAIASE